MWRPDAPKRDIMTANGTTGFSAHRPLATERLDWVDYAKGICIIMVVMMHSTLGVELAAGSTGFMHSVVEFAKPFRMPDFFLISGLFLAKVIDRDWRTYTDRKVVHFAYFYILWVTIQFAFKAPGMAMENGWTYAVSMYAFSFIEPFGTLWFIYMLPIFFIVTKLTLRIPAPVIWGVAAALEIAAIKTGWTLIDEFAARFVFFYSGYILAEYVFAMVRNVQAKPSLALVVLSLWAVVNGALVHADLAHLPVLSLLLGYAGSAAVVAVAALLAKVRWVDAIRYCGEHTLMIYLAFFLPMAVSRTILLKTNLIGDIGIISVLVTISGVVGALAWWWAVRRTPLAFLFDRPESFWLTAKPRTVTLQAAE
jgi:uncharacterized membrane protein YcfT